MPALNQLDSAVETVASIIGDRVEALYGVAVKKSDMDTLAKAAILATLEGVRHATPAMHKAGEIAIETGSGANYVWTAMLTTLLASMKDGTHVGN